jgi:hypothetical protein
MKVESFNYKVNALPVNDYTMEYDALRIILTK